MKKFREQERLYLIEGAAAMHDAIQANKLPVLVVHDDRALDRETDSDVLNIADEKGLPKRSVTEADLVKMSGLKTAPPIAGVFHMPEEEVPTSLPLGAVVVAFDRVMDPGNLGSLIRSAVFFGVSELWLGEGCVDPYNPKVVRACMAHTCTQSSAGMCSWNKFSRRPWLRERGSSRRTWMLRIGYIQWLRMEIPLFCCSEMNLQGCHPVW